MSASARRGGTWAVPLMVMVMVCVSANPAQAQQGVINRIEEDWELEVSEPDLVAEGPQITTVMSPTADPTAMLIAFNVNYRSQPDYRAGGLEVVAYAGDMVLGTTVQKSDRMNISMERVTWTQSLSVGNGTLEYQIDRGESTTWGKFGQGEGVPLNVSIPSGVSSLSAYTPETSVKNSGPGWQRNRVHSMRLVAVRYYSGGQLMQTDSTPRVVVAP